MHAAPAARNTMQHRHRRVGDLEERALINLPFPIPSIPILDPLLKPLAPILTPLIDGTHPETKTTTTTTTTNTTPAARTTGTTPTQAPAPTATPNTPQPSPTTPSSGTGSGSSSGSGGGDSDGSGSTANDGSGGSNNSGGNSASSSPGGTSNNAGGGDSGAAAAVSGGAPAASGSSTGTPSAVSDSSSAASGSDSKAGADSVRGAASAGGSAAATKLGAVVNANGAAFISGTTAAPGETAVPGESSITPSAGVGGGRGTNGGSSTGSEAWTPSGTSLADPSGSFHANDTAAHHGLSVGIIVAICVILAVLLLLFLAFCCRRRAIAKRLHRRRTWFAAGAYGGPSHHHDHEDYQDGGSPGTRSARSSFATHFDRGNMATPAPLIDFLATPSDEMSQVWPSTLSGSIAVPPASHTVESAPNPTVRAAPDRSSVGSLSSAGSGSRPPSQSSQYLAAPAPAASAEGSPYGADFPSPFSVRPFSPSETFSFPRPPQDDARSRASGIMGGSIASGASAHSAAFFTAEDAPTPAPALDARTSAENPFLDHSEVRPTSLAPSASASASVEQSFESTAGSAREHFAASETVQRPFVPTMDDEMAVAPGDSVRVLRRFDDGWAYAELCASGARGLVPIDTLRAVEEDLPAFLAKKRISSYGARASVLSGGSVGKAV